MTFPRNLVKRKNFNRIKIIEDRQFDQSVTVHFLPHGIQESYFQTNVISECLSVLCDLWF